MTAQQNQEVPPLEHRSRVDPEELARLVRVEQVRLVYDHLPVSQLVMVLNALVFAAVQSLVIGATALIGWFSAVCGVALLRIVAWMAFQRVELLPDGLARWRGLAIAGAAVSGVTWGAAAFLLYPPMNEAHQVFVAFMLGGMVAGSMTTLAPVYPAFALFAVLSLAPMAARVAIQHDPVHYAMGWMIVVFLAAVLVIARRSQHGVADLLRLRAENAKLIGELLVARDQLKRGRNAAEPRLPER